MSIQNLKNQILQNITQINSFDLSRLYPEAENLALWNNLSNEEVKKFVSDIDDNLKLLSENIDLLDTITFNTLSNFNNRLINFINQFNNIQSVNPSQITSHHHGPLNALTDLSDSFRTSGIYSELRIFPNLDEKIRDLKSANPISKRLVNNLPNIEKAIEQVDAWLRNKAKVDSETIKGQATAFLDRAKEHKLSGDSVHRNIFGKKIYTGKIFKNWWLLALILSLGAVSYITYTFISLADGEIYLSESILRISSLLVPGYFAVFSANQYLYHKKMYDIFMFKYASLHTMNSLISNQSNNPQLQEKILAKGLDVLFTEPQVKESSGKYDKQIVGELISMLKSQRNN